jgi:hypothetical protein
MGVERQEPRHTEHCHGDRTQELGEVCAAAVCFPSLRLNSRLKSPPLLLQTGRPEALARGTP